MGKKVTLYIEDNEIKLLVTRRNTVGKWASFLLEPGLVSDGVILDEDKVADNIRSLMKLLKISTRKVSVCLSGLNSIFRVISLPELPQAILPEAVHNEANRVIPVPLDQVYIAYQQLRAPRGETRLFLVAYPKNSTESLITTMEKAGLKTHTMDLAPLALVRNANEPKAIIVNSWLTFLDIVIMADGEPRLIRSLSLPVDGSSMEEKLPAIAEEIGRTIAFYNSSYPAEPLDHSVPVLVSGDLSQLPDSWQRLVGEGTYTVSALTTPIQFPQTFDPGLFMVNIGLAIKGRSFKNGEDYSSIVDMNVLPEAYRPVPVKLTRVIVPPIVAVVVTAAVFTVFAINDLSQQTSTLKSETADLNSQVSDVRSSILTVNKTISDRNNEIETLPQELIPLEEQLLEVQTTTDILEFQLTGLEEDLDKTNRDIIEVVNLLPDNINLLTVHYSNVSEMTVSGSAPSESEIFTYARALRSGGR
ncbi:MAG: pilus assembly protein PilM, partial [Dehalococcoidales bacterium]|nr:pilus assembly protein PilM [Dehalococcoidales bacterium]